MSEPASWRYETITKPMVDIPSPERLFLGRVIPCTGDTVIEDGFVHVRDGKIAAVGDKANGTESTNCRASQCRIRFRSACSRRRRTWSRA